MQPGGLLAKSKGKTKLFSLDVNTGEIKRGSIDAEKVRDRRERRKTKGTIFDPDYIDPTSFSGRPRETAAAAAQPSIRSMRDDLDAQNAETRQLEEMAARQDAERDFYDEELEIAPGEVVDEAARPREPVGEPTPRPPEEEPNYSYEGTDFVYEDAPANRMPDPNPARAVDDAAVRPEPETPARVRDGGSRVRRAITRRIIPGSAVVGVLAGMGASSPAAADINVAGGQGEIEERLARVRGSRAAVPVPVYRYGTTQNYSPAF